MTRPMKRRRVCSMPGENRFGPLGKGWDRDQAIQLSVEEYEVIRLIDLTEKTQEECAEQIGVARTTVQRIYSEARKKIAQMLIEGKMLLIEGGNFELCGETDSSNFCREGRSRRHGGGDRAEGTGSRGRREGACSEGRPDGMGPKGRREGVCPEGRPDEMGPKGRREGFGQRGKADRMGQKNILAPATTDMVEKSED